VGRFAEPFMFQVKFIFRERWVFQKPYDRVGLGDNLNAAFRPQGGGCVRNIEILHLPDGIEKIDPGYILFKEPQFV
jgi:hypothetical protein